MNFLIQNFRSRVRCLCLALGVAGSLGIAASVAAQELARVDVLHRFSALDGIKVGINAEAMRQNDSRGNFMVGSPILVDGWLYGLGRNVFVTIDKEQTHSYLYRVEAETGAFERIATFPDKGDENSTGFVPGLTLGADGFIYGIAARNIPNFFYSETWHKEDHGGYIYRFRPGSSPVIEKLYAFPYEAWWAFTVTHNSDGSVSTGTVKKYPQGLPVSNLVSGPDGYLYGLLDARDWITGKDAEGNDLPNYDNENPSSRRVSTAMYRYKPGLPLEVIHRFDDFRSFLYDTYSNAGGYSLMQPGGQVHGGSEFSSSGGDLVWVAERNRFYGVRNEREGALVYEIGPDGNDYREVYRVNPARVDREWNLLQLTSGIRNVPVLLDHLIWSSAEGRLLGHATIGWVYWGAYDGVVYAPGGVYNEENEFFSLDPDSGSYHSLGQVAASAPEAWGMVASLALAPDGFVYGSFRLGGNRVIDESLYVSSAYNLRNVVGGYASLKSGSGGIFRLHPENGVEAIHRFGIVEPVPVTQQLDGRTVYAWRNADGMFPKGMRLASDGKFYGISEFGTTRLNGGLFRFTPGAAAPVAPRLTVTLLHMDASVLNPVDQLLAGQSVRVSWLAEGGLNDCQASGAWSGPKADYGTETVLPGSEPGTYRYALSCWLAGVEYAEARTVTVFSHEPQIVDASGGPLSLWLMLGLAACGWVRLRCRETGGDGIRQAR